MGTGPSTQTDDKAMRKLSLRGITVFRLCLYSFHLELEFGRGKNSLLWSNHQ